jgi:hypothetical protein
VRTAGDGYGDVTVKAMAMAMAMEKVPRARRRANEKEHSVSKVPLSLRRTV